MRNVKALWSIICLLSVCVLILVSGRIFSTTELPLKDKGRAASPSQNKEQVIATIGDRTITYEQFQQKLELLYGRELLNQMLDREAVKQEADSLGIEIDKQQIDNELKLMQQGYDSEEQYYESMRKQLGLSREQIVEDVYYRLMLEQVAIQGIKISDAVLEEYLGTDSDIYEHHVQLHIHEILVGTLEEAEEIGGKLRNGADFAKLAEERSLDEMSASYGGDLGLVEADDPFVPPIIMQRASQLPVHEISEPVPVDDGYAIIKVTERKEPTLQEIERLREKTRKELALSEAPPLDEVVSKIRKQRNTTILDPRFK